MAQKALTVDELEPEVQRIGRELADALPVAGAPSAAGARRAGDGARLARRRAARRALPARRRDARVPLARRPRPPPRRVPRARWTSAPPPLDAAMRAGRLARRPQGARAPRPRPASGTWRTASSSASRRGTRSQVLRALWRRRRRHVGRPARRGDRDAAGGRPLRGALRRGARDARRAARSWPERPGSSATRSARCRGQPVGEGVGAHAAAAARGARARPRRRRRPPAAAAAPGARPRRPPARGHGVARLARDDARSSCSSCSTRTSSATARRPGSCCRPTCATRRRSSSGSSTGRARTPRTPPLTIRLVKGAYWDHEVVEARQHGWTRAGLRGARPTATATSRS